MPSWLRHLPTASVTGLAGLLVAFLLLPLLALITSVPPSAIVGQLTNRVVQTSLGFTLVASLIALGLSFAFGVPLGYLLARRTFPGKSVVESIVLLPLVLPHLIAGLALLMLLGPDAPLGQLLARAGVPVWDTIWGVVAVMTYVSASYLVSATQAAFRTIDADLVGVARTLGASRGDAFLTVSFPLALRGILGGAGLSWARSLSEIGGLLVLGYTVYPWPAGSQQPVWSPISIYIFQTYQVSSAEAFATAALLLLVALVVFLVVRLAEWGVRTWTARRELGP